MKKIIMLAAIVSFQAMSSEQYINYSSEQYTESVDSYVIQSDDVLSEIENDGFAEVSIIEINSDFNQETQQSCLGRYNQFLNLGKKRTKILRISLVSGVAILAAAPMLTGAGFAFAAVGTAAAASGTGGAISSLVGVGFAFGGVTAAGAISSLWEPTILSGLEKGILAARWASSSNSTSAPRFLYRMIHKEQDIILNNMKEDIQLRNPNESKKVIKALFMDEVQKRSKEISITSIQKVKKFINEKLSNNVLCPEDKLPFNLQKIEKLHRKQL